MNFSTKDQVKAKAINRLGFDLPAQKDALEIVQRSDFRTDDEFLDACAKYAMQFDDARFREVRNDLARKYYDQRQAELDAENVRIEQEIRANTRLSVDERQEIETRAAANAAADMRNGKIQPNEYRRTVAKYTDDMCKAQLNHKVECAFMSDMIRRERDRNRISADTNA